MRLADKTKVHGRLIAAAWALDDSMSRRAAHHLLLAETP